jgi:gliding motility-associated-like protein
VYSKLGDTLITWTFGDGNGTVNMDPIIHSYDGEGPFTVTLNVKYRSCPEKTTQRDIRVFGIPSVYLGQDTSICPGGIPIKVRDDRNASNPSARWKWSTGETTSSITVVKPGSYSTVVTIDGCSSSDTILVKRDCYMEVPNVFTPNGDGTNDFFFPRQLLTRGLTSFKMEVYNRWGQTVYSSNSIDGRGWDGNFNDKPQPEGVYIYLIEAKFKDGQMENHQGNVTLLR